MQTPPARLAGLLRLCLQLCSFVCCGVYLAYVFFGQTPVYRELYSKTISKWSVHRRDGVSILNGKAITVILFLWVPLIIASCCTLLYRSICSFTVPWLKWHSVASKLRRFLCRQLPPTQFWSRWCGGIRVGDALLVKFWVLLNAGYLINLMSRYMANINAAFSSEALPDARWQYVLERLAFSFGVMMGPNLLLLFLPIPHSSFLNILTGIPHARMIKYHRWLGHGTMCVLTVHGSLFYLYWITRGGWWVNFSNWGTLHSVNNLAGSLAYLCGLVLWISAAGWVRRRFYQVFFRFHLACFLGFFVLAHVHYSGNYKYFVPGLLLYAVDLVLRAGQLCNVTTVTAASVKPSGGVATMELQAGAGLSCCPLKELYLVFPTISRWQWHPFTVAGTSPGGGLVFHIKRHGWFTKRLMLALASGAPLPVRVSGPVGNDSQRGEWERYTSLVFIGGGVGVTPLLSILRHMAHSRGQQGWREGAAPPHAHLVWVCRHLEEFTCLDGDLLAAASGGNGWLTISLYYTGSASHQEVELSVSAKSSLLPTADPGQCARSELDPEGGAEAPDAPFYFTHPRAPLMQSTLCRRIQPAAANDLHLVWVLVLVCLGAFCAQFLAGWVSAEHAARLASSGVEEEAGYQWKVGLALGILQPLLALGTPLVLAIFPFHLWRYWQAKRAVQRGHYSQAAELAHPWSGQHNLVARECVVMGDRLYLPGLGLEVAVQSGRPDIQELLRAAAKGTGSVGVYVGGPLPLREKVAFAVEELNYKSSTPGYDLYNEVSPL